MYGTALTTSFAAAALATLAAPAPRRLLAAFCTAHGATWPLLSTVLHGTVSAAHRATAVSAMSLAMALGGILGNLVLPSVVRVAGVEGAFLAVAVLVLLSALLSLRLLDGTATATGR